MSTNPELLLKLLEHGVPWPIAREAAASTAIDKDERAQTISLAEKEHDES